MSIFLETERLVLKTPQPLDLDDLYALQSDPEVMRYVGTGIRTRQEVQEGLMKAIAHQETYGFSLGSVFKKSTGVFVGRAGLIYLGYDDSQPHIEIGYALLKAYWNKGYATELADALIKWGLKNLPVTKLVAVINSENQASRHVLEKVGMQYVRQSSYHDLEVDLYEIPLQI